MKAFWLKAISILSMFIVGTILVKWSSGYNFGISSDFKVTMGFVGAGWILLGVLLSFVGKLRSRPLMLGILIFNSSYLIIEFIYYILIIGGIFESPVWMINHGNFGLFNKPCCVYDSISGYKWLNRECELVKIINGEFIFERKFTPNKQGYISNRDYSYRKKDSTTFRYMIFGDSYTTAEFNFQSWPDQVQEILNEGSKGQKLELYSFAVDGAGLFNWYRIFFKEVIPDYEFDGIILAIWGDDIDRPFTIMHHSDTACYFDYFQTVPKDFKDFKENYLPKMIHPAQILPDSVLNKKIRDAKRNTAKKLDVAPPNLYFLIKVYDTFNPRFIKDPESQLKAYNINTFEDIHGKEKVAMLDSIINYCKLNGKRVILCNLPDKSGIKSLHTDKFDDILPVEVRALARHYKVDYFDGLSIYRQIPDNEMLEYFVKYDPHWNQKGSDIFADSFSVYLRDLHGLN